MRRVALAVLAAAVLVPPAAQAASTATRPVYDSQGRLVQAPFAPVVEPARLTEKEATAILLAHGKVADWLDRYPEDDRVTEATFDKERRDWEVGVWWGEAGQIATGRVDDRTGRVTEAWTGPQVAWKMARGGEGAFGGRQINSVPIWLGFCLLFLVGLADWRRPLSVRNLDLLVLLSFSVSLWFFNRGEIFTSVPLVYPPMLYLLGPHGLDHLARRAGGIARRLAGVADRSGHTVPRRLPGRHERARLECDRRRLLGCDRRPPDRARRVAVRPHAELRTTSSRAARRARTGRSATACRRTVAASPRTSVATRTGPWRTRPTSRVPRAGLERQVGRPSRLARDGDRLRPARPPRPGARRAPLRWGEARRAASFRLGRLSVHAVRLELEHERRDHARPAHLRVLARGVAVRAWRVPRAGRVDEVRGPGSRSAVGRLSRSAAAASERAYLQEALRSRP